MKELKNIAILGAGVMGYQVALLCAEAGLNVKIRDIDEQILSTSRKNMERQLDRGIKKGRLSDQDKKETLHKIMFTLDLKEAVKDADYVIEAVPEVMEIKHKVFKEAYKFAPKHAVFGTNTSSLVISDVAAAIPEPERMIGIHFFNPPGVMKLLEIIYGEKTGEEAKKATDQLAKLIHRENVYCLKDTPGFVPVRLLMAMINECAWAVELDNANLVDVDASLKYRLGLPMGMFEFLDVMDGGSIELHHEIGSYLRNKLGESWSNPPIIEKKYLAGNLGKKAGKGFYDWAEGKTNEIPFKAARNFNPIRVFAPVANLALRLVEDGVMSKEDVDKSTILGLGFPRGILRMADSIGLDVIASKMNELHSATGEERYKCSTTLEKLVSENKLGRKTGQGVYNYGRGEFEMINLAFEDDKRIARLTINRPHRANALNLDCYAEINGALDMIESDNAVKCLIITGSGKFFCAGLDISTFGSGNMEEINQVLNPVADFHTRLETLGKPIIAAINGICLGGGLELAIACDLRIAMKGAVMGLPEANLGIFPGGGGTQRITRLIGWARAKELVLKAENIKAEKALEWGLVNTVAEKDDFEDIVRQTAQNMADKACLAQSIAKQVLYYGAQIDQRSGLFLESHSFPPVLLSEQASEGITAFMYRRKPKF